jgi:glycosyltransferase involved in cell wall biosynthesis
VIVTQISIGRFHHFHLARQLERHGLLKEIWTGYPKFKLRDENGIPLEKIRSFPWLHAPYMARGRIGLSRFQWLNREWSWRSNQMLDHHVANKISSPGVLYALSGSGFEAGKRMQMIGGRYVCDRTSSHIRYQDALLQEEYARWGLQFEGIDPRFIEKEEAEYELADIVSVPSEFVRKSFVDNGVPAEKLRKIPFGARLERFQKISNPSSNGFCVLWVGAVSIRKAFLDALQAFRKFRHPQKKFLVVGAVEPAMRKLLLKENLDNVVFRGVVPNTELASVYSSSHAFVLPSIEEGLAMVQGEALACGCPVIATHHTGASDLFADGLEGFIVPIRRPDLIADRLQQLADDPQLRQQMSQAALERVSCIGGWDTFGDEISNLILELKESTTF